MTKLCIQQVTQLLESISNADQMSAPLARTATSSSMFGGWTWSSSNAGHPVTVRGVRGPELRLEGRIVRGGVRPDVVGGPAVVGPVLHDRAGSFAGIRKRLVRRDPLVEIAARGVLHRGNAIVRPEMLRARRDVLRASPHRVVHDGEGKGGARAHVTLVLDGSLGGVEAMIDHVGVRARPIGADRRPRRRDLHPQSCRGFRGSSPTT